MMTRVLFVLVLLGASAPASAEEAKVLALGITDHQVAQEELDKGVALPPPHFNTPAIAYASVACLKKGDTVEITLVNGDTPLLRNTETLAGDEAEYLLQAGKRGVPAGGWPEGSYHAALKVTRDGKTLIEQSSQPIPFD
jgi:hypothetical protein